MQNWSTDPAIYDLIEAEYKRGYFRGVGEFHIYGNTAQAPLVKQVVDFAAARNLYLLAHCDEAALLILLAHNRSAKIIWAHTGFSTPTRRVRELLETNPELMGELSYRGGISEGGGKLAADWRELFARHSDRFLLGSDTWINERWFGYDTIMQTYRGWLAQLPEEQAKRIASAQDALFRSVQTGEWSNSMNGSYGTRTIGGPEVGTTLASTAKARMALFRTSADASLIPYTRSPTISCLLPA